MVEAVIRSVRPSDREAWAEMRALLWPDASVTEHGFELDENFASGGRSTLPTMTFVAEHDGGIIGFLEAGLRSHADGCDERRPVGYVEGWFVREPYRHQGIGNALLQAAEAWALHQGCIEMASDALIDNVDSQRAHQALGFEIVDRCVNFRKQLKTFA